MLSSTDALPDWCREAVMRSWGPITRGPPLKTYINNCLTYRGTGLGVGAFVQQYCLKCHNRVCSGALGSGGTSVQALLQPIPLQVSRLVPVRQGPFTCVGCGYPNDYVEGPYWCSSCRALGRATV